MQCSKTSYTVLLITTLCHTTSAMLLHTNDQGTSLHETDQGLATADPAPLSALTELTRRDKARLFPELLKRMVDGSKRHAHARGKQAADIGVVAGMIGGIPGHLIIPGAGHILGAGVGFPVGYLLGGICGSVEGARKSFKQATAGATPQGLAPLDEDESTFDRQSRVVALMAAMKDGTLKDHLQRGLAQACQTPGGTAGAGIGLVAYHLFEWVLIDGIIGVYIGLHCHQAWAGTVVVCWNGSWFLMKQAVAIMGSAKLGDRYLNDYAWSQRLGTWMKERLRKNGIQVEDKTEIVVENITEEQAQRIIASAAHEDTQQDHTQQSNDLDKSAEP